ncbi:type I polyketide synthase, partial [Herpetosiphon giganteus]|uniref:type I polyketide synthase n=1 Tax=Herpetosiphon giganteus TaxID=2029754 RepID=UPI00195A7B30
VLPSLHPRDPSPATTLAALAQLYTAGVDLQWNSNRPTTPNLNLPTYPFQRERHWVRPVKHSVMPVHNQAYPFLGQRLPLPNSQEIRYSTTFSQTFPSYLSHHRIFNTVVIPGASHIAMLIAAAEQVTNSETCLLEDILFPQPLTLAETEIRTVQVILVPRQAGGWNATIMSALADTLDDWVTHTTAVIKAHHQTSPASPINYRESLERCQQHQDGATIYRDIQAIGFDLGSAFQWMRDLWQGAGESVGKLVEPNLPDARTAYPIYPGLIDSCFQVFSNCLDFKTDSDREPSVVIPFAIERIIVHRRPADQLWCIAQKYDHGQTSGAILLVDDNGLPLVEFHGASGRRATQTALDAAENWFYTLDWQTSTIPVSTKHECSWLIYAEDAHNRQALTHMLQERGHECHHAELNPAVTHQSMLQAISHWQQHSRLPCEGIIFIASDQASNHAPTLQTIEQAYQRQQFGLLQLAQVLISNPTTQLWVISHANLQAAEGLAQSASRGLIKTLHLEQPGLFGARIELETTTDKDWATCCRLLEAPATGEFYRLQADRLLTERLLPIKLASAPLSIRPDHSYLISGGLSGLGLASAQWLSQQGARFIILLGRSAPTQAAQAIIAAMEQQGTVVTTVAVDVADREMLNRLWAEVVAKLPAIAGVIHAAGIIDDGIIAHQHAERFQHVARAKVQGSWNLHELTGSNQLDFFVLYSSVAAAIGSPGQSNYAAANAFLDALASYRRSHGLTGLSINWGPWAEIGMAAHLQTGQSDQFLRPIYPEQGVGLLNRLLGQQRSQIAVLAADWSRWPGTNVQPLLERVLQSTPYRQHAPASSSQLLDIDIRQRWERLYTPLREQVAHSLRLPLEQLDDNEPLPNLGLDSLMAVEIKQFIATSYSINVPIMKIIEGSNLQQLVWLTYHQFHLDQIDRLSEDDIDYLLAILLPSSISKELA